GDLAVPDARGVDRFIPRLLRQIPLKQPPGIFLLVLRVAAGGHVEDDSAFAFLPRSLGSKVQAQLRLADAGRAGDDGERSGHKTAPKQSIKFWNSSGKPVARGHQAHFPLSTKVPRRRVGLVWL